MSSGMYVSLSGQLALEQRLQSIANNVANMNTGGYRAEGVKFEAGLFTTASGLAEVIIPPRSPLIGERLFPGGAPILWGQLALLA